MSETKGKYFCTEDIVVQFCPFKYKSNLQTILFCYYPISILKIISFHFPIYMAIYPKSNIVHRCFTSSCFKKSVGKEFGMTSYGTLSCCDCGVLFEDQEECIEEVSYLFYLRILQI